MRTTRNGFRKPAPAIFSTLAMIAVMLFAATVSTQSRTAQADDLPILVLADDEDPASVVRSSSLFRDLVAEFAAALNRMNMRVITEEEFVSDLGWVVRDRASRPDMIHMLKEAAKFDTKKEIRGVVFLRFSAATQRLSDQWADLRIEMRTELVSFPALQTLDRFEGRPFYAYFAFAVRQTVPSGPCKRSIRRYGR